MLTRNAEPHQNSSSSAPETIGPSAPPAPAKPTHRAIASLAFLGREHGGDQRQRRRHHERRTGTLYSTTDDDEFRRARQTTDQRAEGEHAETEEQRPFATEAVAESARREQQAGEHKGVGVDDPLQHRGAGIQLGLQRRHRHVERGHRHHDHDQREAQHAEQEPATLVNVGPGVQREIRHWRSSSHCVPRPRRPLRPVPGGGRCD